MFQSHLNFSIEFIPLQIGSCPCVKRLSGGIQNLLRSVFEDGFQLPAHFRVLLRALSV